MYSSKTSHSNYFSKNKYGKLIPKSFYKEIQNDMFSLFIYMRDESPPFFWLHPIISFIRLAQYIGNIFFGIRSQFFQSQNVYWFVNYITVFSYFFTPSIRLRITGYLSYFYGVFWMIFLILMLILSKILKMKGALPQLIKVTMTFIIFSFGYIFHPTVDQLFEVSLGNIISGTNIVPFSQRVVNLFFL
jgi:hypothetical protein